MTGYLCVDQMPSTVTTADLWALVRHWNGVRRCHVARDADGASLGFGFIETNTTREAERILEALDGTPIQGRPIRVSRFDGALAGVA